MKKITAAALAVGFALSLSAGASLGAAPRSSTRPSARAALPPPDAKVVQAVRVTEPIVLDGRLDEAVWKTTPPATGFTQNDPQDGTPATEPTEPILRAGLHEYFEGKFDDAERDLSDYLNKNGSKRALAFFFRGATRSTRYYLSGQKDQPQKDLALADFRALKEHAAQFDPPKKFVSPQILAIYNEATPAQ